MAATVAQTQVSPQQANMMARQAIIANSLEMRQIIYTQTLTGTIPGQVINIPPRNVGLLKRFVVEVTMNLAQTASETLTRTSLGPANIFSQIVFTDLSNQTRINTSGWHMHLLASVRRMQAYGAAFSNDSTVALGSNFPVLKAPASITTTQQIRHFYDIPLAYSDTDFRGAVYGNVVNATMQLQLTVNPNLVVASGVDPVLAAYQSSTAAVAVPTAFTVTVYQIYQDQLPIGPNGTILPTLDLSTIYMLNNTAVSALTVNNDNPIPYANFRQFMSTIIGYDNAGVLNPGSDINRFQLQSANFTNIFQRDPYEVSLATREMLGDDMPPGFYYFDYRRKPLSTIQFGNLQITVNPSTVTSASGSILLVGYEAMAMQNMISQAGSLYAN